MKSDLIFNDLHPKFSFQHVIKRKVINDALCILHPRKPLEAGVWLTHTTPSVQTGCAPSAQWLQEWKQLLCWTVWVRSRTYQRRPPPRETRVPFWTSVPGSAPPSWLCCPLTPHWPVRGQGPGVPWLLYPGILTPCPRPRPAADKSQPPPSLLVLDSLTQKDLLSTS